MSTKYNSFKYLERILTDHVKCDTKILRSIGTVIRRENKTINISKSYKKQEVVENHDRLRSEGRQHIEIVIVKRK